VLFDAIGLTVALLFLGLGAARGALAGFLRLATVVCAYLAGYLVASHLGRVVALLTGMPRLAVSAGLGMVAFTLVYLVGAIVSTLLIRAERERRDEAPRGSYDRIGGACFGMVQAGVALLLLAVLGSVLDAAYRAGLPQGIDASDSFLVASTRRVVAAGVESALGDSPGAKLAVKLIGEPGPALLALQQLLSGPRFAELQSDPLFWEWVGDGQVDRALTRDSFAALMRDDATRAGLADLGLVPEAARKDPEAFRAAMRTTLEGAAPRIRAIRNDPAIARLAQDPEVRRAIDSGNHAALLANPQVRALISRMLRDFDSDAATPVAPKA
jgi:colicin V production protein